MQITVRNGVAYAHTPAEALPHSHYKGCLTWVVNRDTLEAHIQRQATPPSLVSLWPLGSCAMVATSSTDNSKFRLEPKPSGFETTAQGIMLIFGHHQEAAWCWQILRRVDLASPPPTWCQLVGVQQPSLALAESVQPSTVATEPSPEAGLIQSSQSNIVFCDQMECRSINNKPIESRRLPGQDPGLHLLY